MKIPLIIFASLLAAVSVVAGCSHSDEGDTSPLPKQDTQVRVDNATKNIESSNNMTAEQKQQALNYMQQGAKGAQEMKKSADKMGAGPPK